MALKLALGVLVGLCGVAYSVAQLLRYRRDESDAMSAQWITAQDRRDAITRGQFDGVVGRWPIDRDSDEAA